MNAVGAESDPRTSLSRILGRVGILCIKCVQAAGECTQTRRFHLYIQRDDGFHVFGEIFIEATAFLSAREFIMV
jgi:hypothetical protein